MLAPALAALAAYRQFILFRSVPSTTRPGKTDKFPCSPLTGQIINAHDPAHWTDAAAAYALAPMFGPDYGVGFVLTAADPFYCLDADDCLLPTGTWSPLSMELCAKLPGAIEVSGSGKGLHNWGMGTIPPHGCKNTALGLELYSANRFIALGNPATAVGAIRDTSAQLAAVIAKYFPPTPTCAPADLPDDGPVAEWNGPADDDVLLLRMLNSKPSTAAVFGNRATLADLWDGNVEALARTYPATGEGVYDASSADQALFSHLAWWTGSDAARMRRLADRSALRRDKWEREDYMQRTVGNAIAITNGCYSERPLDVGGDSAGPAVTPITTTGRLASSTVYANPDDQLKMWTGYTYVTDGNVILTDTGQQWGPEQFRNRYGGVQYAVDQANGKFIDDAWKCFTHSQSIRMPKVDHTAFRPDLPPSEIWTRDGASFVNSYRTLQIPRKQGDIAKFLRHLELLLPWERDRMLYLCYAAAVVQYQGTKFQYAPLLQGVPGNGKSLLSKCVAEAVGWRYTHTAKASQLTEKYNSWQIGMILIIVEDIYTATDKAETFETLKPMITDSRQPIRAMQRTERTMDVCCNFILNSNHKDGAKKTKDDRRIMPLFTNQQSQEDLERDKMGPAYFTDLYNWVSQQHGYAMISEYLHTYKIPEEFGLPCLLSRAPLTSSTEEAIAVSLGRVEQEITEAIREQQPGFMNGWVSSIALQEMLVEARMDGSCARGKRRDVMRSLGYDWHPGLRDGTSTKALPNTNRRPVLYVKEGHWSRNMRDGAEIMDAYVRSQMPGAVEMGLVAGVA